MKTFYPSSIILGIILCFISCKNEKTNFISYPEFYRNYNQVKSLIKENQIEEAINKFDSISSRIPHVPSNFYYRLARACAETERCELAKKYLELSLINGQEYGKGIGKNDILGFCNGELNKIVAKEKEIHSKIFNYQYKSIMDSIFQKDQESRTNSDYNQMRITDSLNMKTILGLIDTYGYPHEKIIGEASAFQSFVILLHMDRDQGNKVFKPILDKAYNEGYLSPIGLAWIEDRRRNWGPNKLEPYYYHMPSGNYNSFTNEQIEEINRRRDSIGLSPKN